MTGYYEVKLWGSQGGQYNIGSAYQGGKGGYTKGLLYMYKDEIYYIYVGEGNNNVYASSTFNATIASSGGGATDMRCFVDENNKCIANTDNLEWHNDLSLNSRIMVAGGGAYNYSYTTIGAGGGLIGTSGTVGTGGTQVSAGINSSYSTSNGSFGIGGAGYGGGGGYYGGGGGINSSGGGGSSFISGYQGCVAIAEQTTPGGTRTPRSVNGVQCTAESAANNINCSYHYSEKIFYQTDMKSGTESMPTHDGTSTMTGNSGSGYDKITWLGTTLP